MTTKAQFVKRVEELGCTWEDNDETIEVFSPRGKWFPGPGLHILHADYNRLRGQATKAEAREFLMEDMADGVSECPDAATCDYCTERENDR